MEKYTIHVENIKCGGCANTITTKLNKEYEIKSIDVDVENGTLNIESDIELKSSITKSLLSMGYPESGSVEGLADIKAKANSFVSCAIGKITK